MNVFNPTRPEIQGRSWAVVSAHPLSTLAGARMILAGGNAVDAAVATAAAVGIVEPFDSNLLGGESCILYWNNHKKQLLAVQATGHAPATASLENYTKLGGIPSFGPRSVIVPGSFDGWALLLADFGTLRLTEVLKPAIELAEKGFLVSPKLHTSMTQFHKELLKLPSSSRIYLKEEKPYAINELLLQREYAETLRNISSFDKEGRQRNIAIQAARDWVYRGKLASKLCRFMELEGGLLGADDLASYKAEYVSPISVTYRDREVFTVPPPSQGIALLEALNILEGYDLSRYGHGSPETLHLMIEAMKLGFADREYNVADPTFFKVPVDMLLSKDYARAQRQRIQTNTTLDWPYPPSPGGSSTTTLAAADEEGNLLVATTSIGQLGVVATDTGVVLNNRMRMFHEDPGHPNCVAPRKRVRITLNPVMVFEHGRPSFAVASPGADVQSQAQLQAIVGMVDFSLNPQLAAEIPRWISTEFPNTSIPHEVRKKLQIEPGFSQDVGAALREKGHDLEIGTGPGMLAIIQGSLARGWIAGADPRGETYALAW